MIDKQEPVGWMDSDWHYQLHKKGMVVMHKDEGDVLIGKPQPLYTTPQQRKPLTDEQISKLAVCGVFHADALTIVRAIEAAHGIKE